MANVKNGLAKKNTQVAAAPQHNDQNVVTALKGLLALDSYKNRFDEVLGKKAAGFISSLITVASDSKKFYGVDPRTIIAAGMIAATLDLPINPNLGFAYVIPYKGKATFQMGYKGYIQLAMRSGQYQTINACEVYEGEIININRFTGAVEFGEKKSNKIVGYLAYFKLINGFEKYKYMSMEEMKAHAKKYSKTYDPEKGTWGITDFDSMAIKTVLKLLISKYGILSIDMQGMATAITNDGGVINQDADGNLIASFEGETIEAVEAPQVEILQEAPQPQQEPPIVEMVPPPTDEM